MMRYRNLSGDSGVTAYELIDGGIVVEFANGWKYEYTVESAGLAAVEEMRRRAQAGRGLSGFVARHVGKAYARKFRSTKR